jgi:hypothetical protein
VSSFVGIVVTGEGGGVAAVVVLGGPVVAGGAVVVAGGAVVVAGGAVVAGGMEEVASVEARAAAMTEGGVVEEVEEEAMVDTSTVDETTADKEDVESETGSAMFEFCFNEKNCRII